MTEKILGKATPGYFGHFITTLFLIVALGGYFIDLNIAVLIIAGIIAAFRMFSEDISIFTYADKFVIRHSNYFGKMMWREEEYPYSAVTNFDAGSNYIKARNEILITFFTYLIAGRIYLPFIHASKANITIEYLDEFNDTHETKMTFFFRGHEYEDIFERIRQQIR